MEHWHMMCSRFSASPRWSQPMFPGSVHHSTAHKKGFWRKPGPSNFPPEQSSSEGNFKFANRLNNLRWLNSSELISNSKILRSIFNLHKWRARVIPYFWHHCRLTLGLESPECNQQHQTTSGGKRQGSFDLFSFKSWENVVPLSMEVGSKKVGHLSSGMLLRHGSYIKTSVLSPFPIRRWKEKVVKLAASAIAFYILDDFLGDDQESRIPYFPFNNICLHWLQVDNQVGCRTSKQSTAPDSLLKGVPSENKLNKKFF